MTNPAIRVQSLSKRYRIGLREQSPDTLVGSLTSFLRQPIRNLRNLRSLTSFQSGEDQAADVIWALKDVSFEVNQGEVIGIIGRNGAGKSTLLKILARITHPTSGRVELRGRVSSLLEVGTGFHPELTGRDNIYLNGTILGMRKAEIDRKFDQIVDFSGVEKFIDTPVKRYSSGMRVRLAFSVAAHLEPEILLIDEVLAVGDVEFQKKCLGKMGEVAEGGRTVLFVSHNMAAINSLCNYSSWLDNGKLMGIGETERIVREYLSITSKYETLPISKREDRYGSGCAVVEDCQLKYDLNGSTSSEFLLGDEIFIVLRINSIIIGNLLLGVKLRDHLGRVIFAFNSREGGFKLNVTPGKHYAILHIPFLSILPGIYTIDVSINNSYDLELCDRVENAISFRMLSNDIKKSGVPFSSQHGIVYIPHDWCLPEET